MTDERDLRDDLASAEVAVGFRAESLLFKALARELHTEGHHADAYAMEMTAADMTGRAATIERDLRGLPAWPAAS